MILTPAEHAEVLRQIALWPVCATCDGRGPVPGVIGYTGLIRCHCVKGRVPGPIYLTVEGDRYGSTLPHVKYQGSEYGEGWFAAPSRFVEATGPCETCNGTGREYRYEHIDPVTADLHWQERRCPSCEGTGRERAELRVTCPKCEGEGILGINLEPPEQGIHWCDCDDAGSVLFVHATIEVLPVVKSSPPTEVRRFVTAGHAGHYLADRSTNTVDELTFDPLPVPGRDWVVVLDGLVLA